MGRNGRAQVPFAEPVLYQPSQGPVRFLGRGLVVSGPLLVEDLAGAATRYPLAALTFSLAVLGLGGLPPLAGFMSKWQIFVAGFQTHNAWLEGLVIFAALNSVLSLAYYAPLVNRLYRKQPGSVQAEGTPVSLAIQAPLFVLALGVVLLGVWPSLLDGLTQPAAQALIVAFGGH